MPRDRKFEDTGQRNDVLRNRAVYQSSYEWKGGSKRERREKERLLEKDGLRFHEFTYLRSHVQLCERSSNLYRP
jgi:hypothetical protein